MEHSGFCYLFLFRFFSHFMVLSSPRRASSSPLCLYCEQTALLTWHIPGCYVDPFKKGKNLQRTHQLGSHHCDEIKPSTLAGNAGPVKRPVGLVWFHSFNSIFSHQSFRQSVTKCTVQSVLCPTCCTSVAYYILWEGEVGEAVQLAFPVSFCLSFCFVLFFLCDSNSVYIYIYKNIYIISLSWDLLRTTLFYWDFKGKAKFYIN